MKTLKHFALAALVLAGLLIAPATTHADSLSDLSCYLVASVFAFGFTVDWTFGGQTDAAVRAYQQANGLVVDGQVGTQTWQPLLAGK